jgi:hypothetical protein
MNAIMILLYFVRTPPVNPSAMFLPRCTRYCHRSSSPVNSSSNIEPKWALRRAVYLDHILRTSSLDMYTSVPIVVPVRSAPRRKVSFARQLARRGRGGYDVWLFNYALLSKDALENEELPLITTTAISRELISEVLLIGSYAELVDDRPLATTFSSGID